MEAGSFRAFSSIEEEYPLPFIAGVEVLGADSACAVVAFGDSITALGWPRMLAERLNALGLTGVGVLDQGLGGNRVLHPGADQLCLAYGPAGVTRFQQDVLAHAGVRHVLVLHGINDIGHPGSVAPISETVSAEEIFSGLMQVRGVVARAGGSHPCRHPAARWSFRRLVARAGGETPGAERPDPRQPRLRSYLGPGRRPARPLQPDLHAA